MHEITVSIVTETPRAVPGGAVRLMHAFWRRMAQDHDAYTWGSLRVLTPGETGADVTLVINHPGITVPYTAAPLNRTVLARLEPTVVHKHSWGKWTDKAYTDQLLAVLSADDGGHWPVDWNVSLAWADAHEHHPPKSKPCSVVMSWKGYYPGHKHRQRLAMGHLAAMHETVDIWGHLQPPGTHEMPVGFPHWKGDLPVREKDAGLNQYYYHVCAENSSQRGYFTEKIIDAWLCECLPLYWGCPNLDDYVPAESYVRLPMEKPAECAEMIREIIASPDLWRERLPAIREARRMMLDHWQVWPSLERTLKLKSLV
ncbi:MAG: glycosyltransferase family 1 protein [bacterium]|nr:glycosyltransferase family 1 protein [bacterium]